MSLYMAVVTLLAVAYVNLASSEEGMGLCYRCPLHHFEDNEGSVYDWVRSFLKEIKSRCPGLETRLRNTTPRPTTGPITDPQSTITDSPTTPTEPQTTTTKPGYADCQSLFDAGHTMSGVYNITPAQYPDGLEVYCNMTDSDGWIVFQRRLNGEVNFTRNWAEYRDGFGDKEGEFWLGNEILHRLTEPVAGEERWEMQVDLVVDTEGLLYAGVYDDFHIDGKNYTLHVGVFKALESLDDALSPITEPPSNGHPFSTYDRDNDAESSLNCADKLKGGWWFNECPPADPTIGGAGPHSILNGEYSQTFSFWEYGRGIVCSGFTDGIKRSEMKMRRSL